MNSRQRFIQTMDFGSADHPPLFAEGLRDDVLAKWRKQGLPKESSLQSLFIMDEREEVDPDLYPRPEPKKWPNSLKQAEDIKGRLDPNDPRRLPKKWRTIVKSWGREHQVRMLEVHNGFFESVGVDGWGRMKELVLLLKNDQVVVQRLLEIQGEFNAQMADRLLQDTQVEAAIFSEPIGDNNGPLISPSLYRELVLPTYQPVLDVLRKWDIKTIILRTYANCRLLIPVMLEAGFNCLWAVEVFGKGMDYRDLRKEFGRDLRLIGGIDLDVLRQDQGFIRSEVETKVPMLLEQGGYAPLADGRVRADVPWENYRYYRELLQEVVLKGS